MLTRAARRAAARPWVRWAAAWAVTRLLLLGLVLTRPGTQQDVRGDVHLYDTWSRAFLHGSAAPIADPRWQYPPGAALVMAGPRLLPVSYLTGFLLLALATDAAVTALLWRRGGRLAGRPALSAATGGRRGAACWIAGIALLGPVCLARFDIAAAAATVAALLSPAVTGGILLGAGAGIKLWPALVALLPAGRSGTDRPAARAAGLAAGAIVVTVPAVLLDAAAAGSAWTHQSARGLQVESLAASPFVVAHMLGLAPAAGYSYGAFQVTGRAAGILATAGLAAGAVAVALVLRQAWLPALRHRRGRPGGCCPPAATAAAAVLLCVLAGYRVLSPQYLLWPLATLCVAVARGERGSGRTAGLLLGAAGLTQVVYPWRYNDLLQGRSPASLLLLSRNVLLAAAAVSAAVAVRQAVRASVTASDRRLAVAASVPNAPAAISASVPPAGISADSGPSVGNEASTMNADSAPSHRRDVSPAAASTAIAGAKYQA